MNILITAPSLHPSTNVSGISTVVNTICANNDKHRYFHYLLGRPDKVNTLLYAFIFIKQLVYFPVFIKNRKIHLVHQNLPFDPKGLLRESIINLWCHLLRIPVVLHIHGGTFLMREQHSKIWKRLTTNLFKRSSKVVVLSDLEKDALLKYHEFGNAEVLSNSISVSDYACPERIYDIHRPTFLFLGRLHESKGLDDIYDAFTLLKKEKLNFRLLMCGTGPLKETSLAKFSELLSERFEYRGIVAGQEKLAILKESDYFLLPSRYGEGLPMALLEAMAAGLVPIVTDDASMKHIVKHRVNGLRVEKRNGTDIFRKIKELLGIPSEVIKLQQASVNTVEAKYDIGPYILRLNEIYKDSC